MIELLFAQSLLSYTALAGRAATDRHRHRRRRSPLQSLPPLRMLGPAVLASCVAQLAMRPTFVTFGDSITQRGFAPGWTGQLADAYQRRVDVLNRGERFSSRRCCQCRLFAFSVRLQQWL